MIVASLSTVYISGPISTRNRGGYMIAVLILNYLSLISSVEPIQVKASFQIIKTIVKTTRNRFYNIYFVVVDRRRFIHTNGESKFQF